jgi:CheY-like chemotaxis protein
MKHKILIADDSLTIQKVIKITLASEPFELLECTDANQLESSLNETKPSIVLLDFNLSEDKTGYDLARDIKRINPNTKILMLFGTFDTVDEGLLEESGVNHKIVKPFDGTKFINLCRVMADELDVEDAQSINDVEEDFNTNDFPEPIEEDDWVVEGAQSFEENEEEPEVIEEVSATSENKLDDHLKDWGMDVPGVIGGASSNNEIPGVIGAMPEVIEETVEAAQSEPIEDSAPVSAESLDDSVLPSGDDLAYPDMDDLAYPDEISASEENVETQEDEGGSLLPSNDDLEFPDMDSVSNIEIEDKPKPQLRSIEIADDEEPVVEEIEVSSGGTDTDEALSALKAEIEDELDDKIEASDDLWGADVVVEDNSPKEQEVEEDKVENEEFVATQTEDFPHVESHQLEKVVDNTKDQPVSFDDDSFDEVHDMSGPDDFPADVMEDEPARPAATFTPESMPTDTDLEARLREKLTPVVEDFVKQFCAENVEKIAWEIIPDLAENLIKKEIQRISDSIIDS